MQYFVCLTRKKCNFIRLPRAVHYICLKQTKISPYLLSVPSLLNGYTKALLNHIICKYRSPYRAVFAYTK